MLRLTARFIENIPSSIVVYLVALPLCLGIALASDAPLSAGLVAGIVAGIVIGALSGSELSVSGPAAGLTVIVASQIKELGSFDAFLCVVLVSGVFQLLFSFLKGGWVGGVFPSAVIQGMLAAIGITITLKQVPHLLGRDITYEGSLFFESLSSDSNTFSDIARSLGTISLCAVVVSVVSIALLLFWDTWRRPKWLKHVPGALLVVGVGILIHWLFKKWLPDYAFSEGGQHLVSIPVGTGLQGLVRSPDWSFFANSKIYTMGLTLALVGSIETLLSVEAADRIDPKHRISDPNRELFAQGVGNVLSGALGGLPVTSVIVRSSANVFAGATSRISSIFHGLWILASVLLIAQTLNQIPIASLAAILVVLGYKLTHLKIYKKYWAAGIDQFLPFAVTIVAIVFTDLLKGVAIGFLVGAALALKRNHYSAIIKVDEGGRHYIRFIKDVSFINKLKLRKILASIPDGAHVIVEGSRAMFVDQDILDVLEQFSQTAVQKGIQIECLHLEGKQYPPSLRQRRSHG